MIKICEFCGKEFEASSGHQKYCKGPHYRICPVCGKQYLEDNNENLKRPPVACSYQCRAKKTKETSLKKYGVPAPGNNPEARNKSKQTMQERYGVDYTLQSKELSEKVKKTNLKTYGFENAGKSKQVIEKRQETNRSKYGDVMPFNRKECYEKQHATMLEKYGVPYFVLSDEFYKYGGNMVSKINMNFQKKLSDIGIESELEYRINRNSYDLHILNTNILIEIDPTYTHSTYGNHWNPDGIAKEYHMYKSLLAEDNGFQCIHIFDWDDKGKIVESLQPKINISADSCQIWRLTIDATNEFLDRYHYSGRCRNQVLCLGLVRNDEILQVVTFGRSIYNKNYDIVIRRMCTKFGYEVVGGYNKLLHYMTEVMEFDKIIAYCDIAKESRLFYEELDMTLVKRNPPRKIWSKDDKYMVDYFAKQYFWKNKDMTEKSFDEFMIENDWLPIYDCGQYVFEY